MAPLVDSFAGNSTLKPPSAEDLSETLDAMGRMIGALRAQRATLRARDPDGEELRQSDAWMREMSGELGAYIRALEAIPHNEITAEQRAGVAALVNLFKLLASEMTAGAPARGN